jgi:hypothetical protein
MSFAELTIRKHVASYLAGSLSLLDFAGLIAALAWNHFESTDSAEQLANSVELWLAEYSNGHRTETELQGLLRPLVTDYSVSVAIDVFLSTGASYSLVKPQMTMSPRLFGRPLVAASL